jgi:hypothetical protein
VAQRSRASRIRNQNGHCSDDRASAITSISPIKSNLSHCDLSPEPAISTTTPDNRAAGFRALTKTSCVDPHSSTIAPAPAGSARSTITAFEARHTNIDLITSQNHIRAASAGFTNRDTRNSIRRDNACDIDLFCVDDQVRPSP